MGIDDFAGNVSDARIADTAVKFALTFSREATLWKTEGSAVLPEEVLLLKSKPSVGIVNDGSTGIGRMRLSIGKHHFAQH